MVNAIKGKANWSELKRHYTIQLNNPFDFIFQLVKILNLWIQAKINVADRWAVIDEKNVQLTPFVYDEIGKSCNEIAFVRINKKWGALNRVGDEIVPIKFNSIGFLSNHYENNLHVNNPDYWPNHYEWELLPDIKHILVKQGTRYGIYSLEGKMVLRPVYDKLVNVNTMAHHWLVMHNQLSKLNLLPKKQCLIGGICKNDIGSFSSIACDFYHLLIERDNGFEILNIKGHRWPEIAVAAETGFILVVDENYNYLLISPNCKIYQYEGYPNIDSGYLEIKDSFTTKILNIEKDTLYDSMDDARGYSTI